MFNSTHFFGTKRRQACCSYFHSTPFSGRLIRPWLCNHFAPFTHREPSAGTGNFVPLIPANIWDPKKCTGDKATLLAPHPGGHEKPRVRTIPNLSSLWTPRRPQICSHFDGPSACTGFVAPLIPPKFGDPKKVQVKYSNFDCPPPRDHEKARVMEPP